MLVGSFTYTLLSTLLGLVYPAYCSFKALRTKTTEDDTQWLTYWILYAAFGALEFVPDFLLASWMPLYFEAKLFLLFWLQAPYFQGATYVYKKRLEPWLEANQEQIDKRLAEAGAQLKTLRSEDIKAYAETAFKYASSLAASAQQAAAPTPVKGEAAVKAETPPKDETAETDKDK